MKKYEIINHEGGFAIYSSEESAFFAGYDFMGSVDWVKIPNIKCLMTKEEAEDIVSDLEAADYEEEFPADKRYLFKARIEDEQILSIETGKRIAEIYDEDQLCGIYSDMEVWDVSGEPERISLLDLVGPILEQKRWMEQEYRDYCDAVNEYGYDFEGRDE